MVVINMFSIDLILLQVHFHIPLRDLYQFRRSPYFSGGDTSTSSPPRTQPVGDCCTDLNSVYIFPGRGYPDVR